MKDDSHNKVCFDCAGIPVIRKIVLNMREAGVQQIVVVVGHMAQDVMDALDGIEGIVYVYQKVQNGTGSAAMVGMRALKSMGFSGSVFVSVGDKIISVFVVREFVEKAKGLKAVYGVQPRDLNYAGGRIALRDGKPYGICELTDAALLKILPEPREKWKTELKGIGLNSSKAEKVLRKAEDLAGSGIPEEKGAVTLGGVEFTADELLDSPYTNMSLYCFELSSVLDVLERCTPRNAQGEIYLTDTMSFFAENGEADLYVVDQEEDVLTYSTKPELVAMSRHFMRTASEMMWDGEERKRLLLQAFIEKYGDVKVIMTRAPGRVNILGRHVDHRGGNTNVMAIDRDTILVVSPRDDHIVRIANTNPEYEDFSFNYEKIYNLAPHDDWISFIESEPIRLITEGNRGSWANYFMAAILRFQFSSDLPLCGMNIMMDGNIPVAAGLSSSSSIVVAAAEAVVALNCLNIPTARFVDMCGEGEWFVGTRGGAGDQAAMKCSEVGHITQLGFKPFYIGKSERFSDKYAIIVADSNIKSAKAAGSKDIYNAKVAAYEISFMLMKKYFPEYNMVELRDAAKIRPYSNIYKMLKRLPETATREEIFDLLPESSKRIEQIFSSHADPGTYDLRGVALFGISECARSAKCLDYLAKEDYIGLGRLMKISHDGDRVTGQFPMSISDEYLIRCSDENANVALQPGAYACSVPEIDDLCDMLDATDGVLGSQMLGAGLGGCLVALVKREQVEAVIEKLNKEYYDAHGYPHLARVYKPGKGSTVEY